MLLRIKQKGKAKPRTDLGFAFYSEKLRIAGRTPCSLLLTQKGTPLHA